MKFYMNLIKKLWIYICITDNTKVTYEQFADAIGLSNDELTLCKLLEREKLYEL